VKAVSLLVGLCFFVVAGELVAAPGDSALPDPNQSADQFPALTEAAKRIAEAQATVDGAKRRQALDAARQLLDAFLRDHPTHEEVPRAEMQLGVLRTVEGKAAAAAATTEADPAARETRLAAARKSLREADQNFAVATERYTAQLDELPSFIPPDTPEHRRKESLRGMYIQARMYHAGVVEELAATYPPGSAEAIELYQAAADRYEVLYREYRTLYAGLVARLKQGQCYRNLGNTKRALGLYHDLLSQPGDIEGLRRLRVTSMYLSLECWTSTQEKLYELALSQGEEFLKQYRQSEAAWPEWQAVRYHTARGYLLAATQLPVGTTERDDFLTQAESHLAAVRATTGPYRDAAQDVAAEVRRAMEK
jgi:tetratricopeptide (TPR) repeat protein